MTLSRNLCCVRLNCLTVVNQTSSPISPPNFMRKHMAAITRRCKDSEILTINSAGHGAKRKVRVAEVSKSEMNLKIVDKSAKVLTPDDNRASTLSPAQRSLIKREKARLFCQKKIAFAEVTAARKAATEARMDATNARTEATNARAVAKLCAAALAADEVADKRNKSLEIKALVEAAMLSEDAAHRAEERRVKEISELSDALNGLRTERDEFASVVATVKEDRAAAAAAFAAAAAGYHSLENERRHYLSRAADAVEAAATIASRVSTAETRAIYAEMALAAANAANAARVAELECQLAMTQTSKSWPSRR